MTGSSRLDVDSLSSSLSSSTFPEFGWFSRKNRLGLVQGIFAKYSKLGLSVQTDKPLAVAGLEYRLATYYRTLTVYGVFAKFLHETLLWRRGTDRLQPIDFPGKLKDRPPSWSWMAYTGGIDYLPVRDASSASKTDVKFDYQKTSTRCALVAPLWKVSMATSLEKCEDTNFNLNEADSEDFYWVRYDDGRELDGKKVDCLEFIPILNFESGFIYGLLVEFINHEYRRVGIASVQKLPDDYIADKIRVI